MDKGLKVGDKIRIDKLETVIEYFKAIDENEMVGTPYGEFNIGLVEKIEDHTPENGLTYAKGYHEYDLKDFVGLMPIRELEDNEEIDGICQIKDERTGITHIGFVVKKWDTASIYTSEWIGSKPVKDPIAILNREIDYHSGGEELKSMNESMCDNGIVKILKKIKKELL